MNVTSFALNDSAKVKVTEARPGSTWSIGLTFPPGDGSDGTTVNFDLVDGATAQLIDSRSGDIVLDFTVTIDPETGSVVISAPPDDTLSVPAGTYTCELEFRGVTDGEGYDRWCPIVFLFDVTRRYGRW